MPRRPKGAPGVYVGRGDNRRLIRPPSNKRKATYYDTETGRWFMTEWEYRNKRAQNLRGSGGSEAERLRRRKGQRAKGRTPVTRKRDISVSRHYNEYVGMADDVARYIRRYPNNAGYVQVFIPGESDPSKRFKGGSKSVGPRNPKDKPEDFVAGEWHTLRYGNRLMDFLVNTAGRETVYDVDPDGDQFVFRVLRATS